MRGLCYPGLAPPEKANIRNVFATGVVDTFMSKMHLSKISETCNFWLKT